MTPQLTINLLRALFVVFTTFIGWQTGEIIFGQNWPGALAGAAFGLAIVLADRLLKGVSLRIFSSATFAHLLLASGVLRDVGPEVQWICSLLVYATCAYLATMLAIRSNRQDFSLLI